MYKIIGMNSSSYSTIVLYSRDHKGLGVAHKIHHPKPSSVSLTMTMHSFFMELAVLSYASLLTAKGVDLVVACDGSPS